MMIADEVGLGKTIIAALVFSELRARGLAAKALFIVPKSLVIKWRDELKGRFETDAVIINSEYVRVNTENPFKKDAFCYIASMDYLKQSHVIKMMEDSNFDFIVVDEAHKFAYGTDRFTLGEFLAKRTNLLLFLTATPHNGDNDDFAQRMKLLDPYFHYSTASSISHLIARNIKEDVVDLEGKEVFPPRESKTLDVSLTNRELHILKDMIDSYISERISEAKTKEELNAVRFLTTIIRKRASSSIHSLKKTLEKRLEKLGTFENVEGAIREIRNSEDDFDEEAYERNEDKIIGYSLARTTKEKEELKEIISKLEGLNDTDSKLEKIIQFIRKTKDTDAASKMVIFTEYRDTMNYLTGKLAQSYKVGNIDGTMNIELNFGKF